MSNRSDVLSVVFKKLEKVGEPYYNSDKKLCQQYKCYTEPLIADEIVYVFADNRAVIEIKQTKEDMEEKKTNFVEEIDALCKRYNMSDGVRTDFMSELKEIIKDKEKCNLKPFDLEKAKDGKPVCTRDGRKARIICFDRIDAKPILALVRSTDGKGEDVFDYFVSGKRLANALESDLDLMMLSEKKEGWVNVYRDCDGVNITKDDNIYSSKEVAIASAHFIDGNNYVATTKINWEE